MARSHVVSHITVASKVNAFLKTKSISPSHKEHCDRLAAWLHTLGMQIGTALPTPPVKEAPPLVLVHAWVEGVVQGAVEIMEGATHLSSTSALQIQAALVAMMVTGYKGSPIRLSIIKSLIHPSRVRRRTLLFTLLPCLPPSYLTSAPLLPSCLAYRWRLAGTRTVGTGVAKGIGWSWWGPPPWMMRGGRERRRRG